jgi:predicted DsbA family dithiol-disulfide isomerase
VWCRNVPTSSLPAHLLVAAARLLDSEQGSASASSFAAAIREAFFEAAVDVSCMAELYAIANHQGIEIADLESKLESGQAHALVAHDLKSADEFGVRSSPTMMFNEGRQTLSGNVGYRVLEANIRELIQHPADQHSWC